MSNGSVRYSRPAAVELVALVLEALEVDNAGTGCCRSKIWIAPKCNDERSSGAEYGSEAAHARAVEAEVLAAKGQEVGDVARSQSPQEALRGRFAVWLYRALDFIEASLVAAIALTAWQSLGSIEQSECRASNVASAFCILALEGFVWKALSTSFYSLLGGLHCVPSRLRSLSCSLPN